MKMVLKFTSIILFAISLNSCAQETKGDEEVETPNNVIETEEQNNVLLVEGIVGLSTGPASNSGKDYDCNVISSLGLGALFLIALPSDHEYWNIYDMSCTVEQQYFHGEIYTNKYGWFTVSGNLNDDGRGFAEISIFEPKSGVNLIQNDCQIIKSDSLVKHHNNLDINVNFDCSKLLDLKNDHTWCQGRGMFAFKNCNK